MVKIAVFFGGKITGHLVLVRRAARKLGVDLELVSYNRVCFETERGEVVVRGATHHGGQAEETMGVMRPVTDFDVLFFRTTGKHWEEVDLILREVKKRGDHEGHPYIVDPIVKSGKPSMACKAYQMLALKEAGIEVPKTIYGSLWYLYEVMKSGVTDSCQRILPVLTPVGVPRMIARGKIDGFESEAPFNFPVIVKGSGGDRGTRVFRANNLEEMEKLVRELRKSETEEGKRYMLQEYIENEGDYRVLVLGEKVLGVMKRSAMQNSGEFRNNYSMGGKVEVAELPEEVKLMAVKAAKVCGLMVAGVDIMPKSPPKSPLDRGDLSKSLRDYVVLEVNKGPQFKGFMTATGIDVPSEIVKFLVELKK